VGCFGGEHRRRGRADRGGGSSGHRPCGRLTRRSPGPGGPGAPTRAGAHAAPGRERRRAGHRAERGSDAADDV
jgi:hypothetical protein